MAAPSVRPVRGACLAALVTAALLGGMLAATVQDLWHNDALDYAQIGRELAQGQGFSSRQAIYVLHLRFAKDHGLLAGPWPNLHRFPLPCLALAASFLVFGTSLFAVLLPGVLAHGGTAAVLYLWARRIWPGFWPAVAAISLFTFNAETFLGPQASLAEPFASFFFTLALYLLWRLGQDTDAPGRPWLVLALAGVCLGLAILSRTNAFTALPGVLLVLVAPWFGGGSFGGRGRRLMAAGVVLAGCTLAVAPWAWRNQQLTGEAGFSLHSYYLLPSAMEDQGTKKDLDQEWVRDFVAPREFLTEDPGAVWRTWRRSFAAFALHYPFFGATFLLPLVAWGALGRRWGGALPSTAWIFVLGLLANATLCSLTDLNPDRYYSHLLPVMTLLGVAVVWNALPERWGSRRAVVWLIVAVLVMANLPALSEALGKSFERSRRKVRPEQMEYLVRHTAPDALLLSDDSGQVTWYTGRRTLRHHFRTLEDGRPVLALLELDDEFGPIDGLYLSEDFFRRKERRLVFENLLALPAMERRFTCEPPFADGAVFCHRG